MNRPKLIDEGVVLRAGELVAAAAQATPGLSVWLQRPASPAELTLLRQGMVDLLRQISDTKERQRVSAALQVIAYAYSESFGMANEVEALRAANQWMHVDPAGMSWRLEAYREWLKERADRREKEEMRRWGLE